MTTAALALVPVPRGPRTPGFARAFGRLVVSGYRGQGAEGGRTVPLAGASVRVYVPGTSTPWPDPLFLDEADATPATFPATTDESGALSLWAEAQGRLEAALSAPGYVEQRVVLDLEFPPAPGGVVIPPEYLTEAEADGLYPRKTDSDPYPQYAQDTDLAAMATDADLTAHVAAADPHPVYLTAAELPPAVDAYTKSESDARFEPIDTMYTKGESDARYAPISGGAYLTQAAADVRYEPIDTMYTKAESDARYVQGGPYLALAGGTVTGAVTFNTGATHLQRLTVAGTAQPVITVAASAPSSPAVGDLWIW